MTIFSKNPAMLALPLLVVAGTAGCAREEPVSYAQDVRPILEKYCYECHLPGGRGTEASGFSMASYADLMKGTAFGPMIIPGDSVASNLLVLMEGRADPSITMPHGKDISVSQQELETIRRWIDQGASDN